MPSSPFLHLFSSPSCVAEYRAYKTKQFSNVATHPKNLNLPNLPFLGATGVEGPDISSAVTSPADTTGSFATQTTSVLSVFVLLSSTLEDVSARFDAFCVSPAVVNVATNSPDKRYWRFATVCVLPAVCV